MSRSKETSIISPARGRVAIYGFLGLVVVLQLLPFWLALTAATKPPDDLSSTLLPRTSDVAWSNFADAVVEGQILRAVVNSLIVTVATTVLVCLLGAMAAYPLARRQTRGNKLVSAGVIALIMIPPLSILVPLYSLLSRMGAINTYWGITLVLTAGGLPLAVFLYTAFVKAVPPEIDEAGMLDGASWVTIFFRLILPLMRPITATVVILTSVGVWNDYALSNYILTDPDMQTIAPRVASFFATQSSNLGAGAAAALIAAVPIVVAYLFLQRYFIAGMVAGSGK